MALSEFQLIREYFAAGAGRDASVRLGIGDDCAILAPPPGELVMSLDTLVAGVHFPLDTAAADIGHKALAVNLSDLAAMGARPQWFMLGLTLPEVNESWLRGFCDGMFTLAQQFQISLIGGDTTRGPLNIGVQISGVVPAGQALRRDGAQVGDDIYVSGQPGWAAAGLQIVQQRLQLDDAQLRARCLQALNRPQPRLALGQALRGLATSAIDVSDGLAADLGHILEASGVGAVIEWDFLPVEVLRAAIGEQAYALALHGGDDYELCFTAPSQLRVELEDLFEQFDCGARRIGHIESEPGLRVRRDGAISPYQMKGYEHFVG